MYRENYDQTIERMQSATELAKDYSNMKRCEENLQHYNRERAWMCLQDMIREYESQINTFGLWIDGVRVVHGVPLEQFSDTHIQNQLQYIASHIPVYVLLREGEKELAKRICQWLDGSGNGKR